MAQMGEKLLWVREAMEKTQDEMATLVGVHQTAWDKYEKGTRSPDQFAATRLIAKLKITRAYLMTGNLDGVEQMLAIRIAARHPELVFPTGTVPDTGTNPA